MNLDKIKDILETKEIKNSIGVLLVGSSSIKIASSLINDNNKCIFAIDTDKNSLDKSKLDNKLFIGSEFTSGLGTNGIMEIGRNAALSSEAIIKNRIKDFSIVIIISNLGGGTGSGVSTELARMAKEQGSIVISSVTMPFLFEGEVIKNNAKNSLEILKNLSDAINIIYNQNYIQDNNSEIKINEIFSKTNSMLFLPYEILNSMLDSSAQLSCSFDEFLSVVDDIGIGYSYELFFNDKKDLKLKLSNFFAKDDINIKIKESSTVLFSLFVPKKMEDINRDIINIINENINTSVTVLNSEKVVNNQKKIRILMWFFTDRHLTENNLDENRLPNMADKQKIIKDFHELLPKFYDNTNKNILETPAVIRHILS